MLMSMTGFGSKEKIVSPYGKLHVELRSTNHKFCEIVIHLPEGFLSLEDKIKKLIESRIKRGRVVCVVNIINGMPTAVMINKPLLKKYITALKKIKNEVKVKDDIDLNTIINLPGILALTDSSHSGAGIWPHLKTLVEQALDNIVAMRQKEGAALSRYLKMRATAVRKEIDFIKVRYKKVINEKISTLKSDEEKTSFIKNSDITEEIERMECHMHNFVGKIAKKEPVGKELDFIAQEMQREANTSGAKSCDAQISARVVEMKSLIEKIREQVQNIE